MATADTFTNILKTHYGIACMGMEEQTKGCSALAYKVSSAHGNFFLKVYDKSATSTSMYMSRIDDYIPVLLWLNTHTPLKDKITRPVMTLDGNCRCEDNHYTYLLLRFIDGETVGDKTLTEGQVSELAGIMACLHEYGEEIPVDTKNIKEDFQLPFCDALEGYFTRDYPRAHGDVKIVLGPYEKQIRAINDTVRARAAALKARNTPMVLCHTDAHGFNMIQGVGLTLLDWEGMKLAPAEADLFMFADHFIFADKAYWDVFMKHYKRYRPAFVLDRKGLAFYISRRIIEDIWFDIERITYDDLPDGQRDEWVARLSKICPHFISMIEK